MSNLPIRTILIEDEEASRMALKQILQEYIPDVKIVGEADSVKEGIRLVKNLDFDLAFMDIHLPDGESFEILEAVDQSEVEFEVIFITAYTEIKKKAFDFFFLQYLTKPFDVDKIEKAVAHFRKSKAKSNQYYTAAIKGIISNEANMLPIPTGKGIEFVEVPQIIRFEASRNYTTLYCKDGKKYLASKNIKHFEENLDSKVFYRVHKSHIINIKQLRSIDNDGLIHLSDGSMVPLAKRIRKDFLDSFK